MNEHDSLVERARLALRMGDRHSAQRLLAAYLHEDPRSIDAWLLMSSVVKEPERKRECLLRVLALDPENTEARAGVEWLTRRVSTTMPDGPRVRPFFPQRTPSAPLRISLIPDLTREHLPLGAEPNAERRRAAGRRNVLIAGAMALSLICGIALLVFTVLRVVPEARQRYVPISEPALYRATLWCPSCARAGSPTALWERIENGVARGLERAMTAPAYCSSRQRPSRSRSSQLTSR